MSISDPVINVKLSYEIDLCDCLCDCSNRGPIQHADEAAMDSRFFLVKYDCHDGKQIRPDLRLRHYHSHGRDNTHLFTRSDFIKLLRNHRLYTFLESVRRKVTRCKFKSKDVDESPAR